MFGIKKLREKVSQYTAEVEYFRKGRDLALKRSFELERELVVMNNKIRCYQVQLGEHPVAIGKLRITVPWIQSNVLE